MTDAAVSAAAAAASSCMPRKHMMHARLADVRTATTITIGNGNIQKNIDNNFRQSEQYAMESTKLFAHCMYPFAADL